VSTSATAKINGSGSVTIDGTFQTGVSVTGLTLAATTYLNGVINLITGAGIVITGSTDAWGNITSSSTSCIVSVTGGSLNVPLLAVATFRSGTYTMTSGGVLNVNGMLHFPLSAAINGAISVAAGTLRIWAGAEISGTAALAVTGGEVQFRGAGARVTGTSLSLTSTSALRFTASTASGFGYTSTFTGQCTLAGNIYIELSSYVYTSRVALITCSSGISGTFARVTTTLSVESPTSRRLMASNGDVTIVGNVVYYDPNAVAGAATLNPSMLLVSLVAVVAAIVARI